MVLGYWGVVQIVLEECVHGTGVLYRGIDVYRCCPLIPFLFFPSNSPPHALTDLSLRGMEDTNRLSSLGLSTSFPIDSSRQLEEDGFNLIYISRVTST